MPPNHHRRHAEDTGPVFGFALPHRLLIPSAKAFAHLEELTANRNHLVACTFAENPGGALARSAGFGVYHAILSVSVENKLVFLREYQRDVNERDEFEAILDTYRAALGMLQDDDESQAPDQAGEQVSTAQP